MIPGPVDASAAAPGLLRDAVAPSREAKSESSFSDLAADVLRSANADQMDAQAKAESLAAGQGDIVESLMALSRADLSLRFVVSLRNRALDAYNEIMRLQL